MIALCLVLSVAAACQASQATAAPARNERVRLELLELAREDQEDRQGISAAVKKNDPQYAKRLTRNDRARTQRLKVIVAEHGWPTAALVGRDGVRAAWLLLQHTEDWTWQQTMLPVLEQAAAAGDVHRADVATLTDRVLVRSGRPQRYGTQFAIVDGRLVAEPIEEESSVDARRAQVGLPPMADYARELAEMYKMPVEWPRRNEGGSAK